MGLSLAEFRMRCVLSFRPTSASRRQKILVSGGIALLAGVLLPSFAMPRPAIPPASPAVRAFVEEAQQRLPPKAFRPFAALPNARGPRFKVPGVFVSTGAT